MKFSDTICSIITGIGAAGVSIIRISGEDAVEIASRICHTSPSFSTLPSHQVVFGRVVDNFTGQFLDEGLFFIMRSPRSYTGEDVVEIQVHGSYLGITTILELVVANGARHAEPGEFSKRAFLNGKMDLTKAEGIIDLIEARNKEQLRIAAESLGGKNYEGVTRLIEKVTEVLAYLEASIDFPEDDVPTLPREEKIQRLELARKEIEEILAMGDKGKYIHQGIKILILGEPNVGKSSFLNLILREERAIVSDIPGTTRDSIEEYLSIGKIPAKIIDTAGIRASDDQIEKMGITRAKDYIAGADVIIYMLDVTNLKSRSLDTIYPLLDGKRKILLLNKADLIDNDEPIQYYQKEYPGEICLPFSTQEAAHLGLLENTLESMFLDSDFDPNAGLLVTNSRQLGLLAKASQYLQQALVSVEKGLEDDFVTIDLYDCKATLEEVIGLSVTEDIIDQIFSKFCIGK